MKMRHVRTLIDGAAGTTRTVLIAVAFVAVGLMALMPVVANPRTGPREIVLVARDMAFYLEGSDAPNPTIVVKPCEEVRVIVRNQDPGITHAFRRRLASRVDQSDRAWVDPGDTVSCAAQSRAGMNMSARRMRR